MRLILSTTNHMNTDISDERGYVHYTVSTFKNVTTITKYRWEDAEGVPDTMGVIKWNWLSKTRFLFDKRDMPASAMLTKRVWNSGWYFTGPDGRSYKWKLEKTHCWMKLARSRVQFVRFHQKNRGIFRQSHPAYLDVSDEVVPMLDHIILTFVYVEQLRAKKRR